MISTATNLSFGLANGPLNNSIRDGLDRAIRASSVQISMHSKLDASGLAALTRQFVIRALAGERFCHLWLGIKDKEVIGFLLAEIRNDLDNRPAYVVNQAFLDPAHRSQGIAQEAWRKVKECARSMACEQILITSARGAKAYRRLLGGSLREYVVMLKEEI